MSDKPGFTDNLAAIMPMLCLIITMAMFGAGIISVIESQTEGTAIAGMLIAGSISLLATVLACRNRK
jgi:hypothetical protein